MLAGDMLLRYYSHAACLCLAIQVEEQVESKSDLNVEKDPASSKDLVIDVKPDADKLESPFEHDMTQEHKGDIDLEGKNQLL